MQAGVGKGTNSIPYCICSEECPSGEDFLGIRLNKGNCARHDHKHEKTTPESGNAIVKVSSVKHGTKKMGQHERAAGDGERKFEVANCLPWHNRPADLDLPGLPTWGRLPH